MQRFYFFVPLFSCIFMYLFIGYAIIQLPDFLLLLHKSLLGMKCFRASINPCGKEMPPTSAIRKETDHCKSDQCIMTVRVRNLEEENIKILKKLDALMVNNMSRNPKY